uniref:Ras-related protein Rab-23 n=1 Tax=Oryctolagus cuniculus TaxID=9986 RepID=G1SMK9_RABIT
MLEEDLEVAIKMVVVGNGAVGKSSMIQRYCKGIFTKDYKKTIGVDFLERQIQVNDEDVRLMLWDTAGQEEFDAITKAYYRGAQACVLVFSTTDRESFEAISSWREKVVAEVGDIPTVLVQNKIDLLDDSCIKNEEAEALAKRLKLRFYRTSVKEDLNVNEVFKYLAEKYLQKLKQQITEDPEVMHSSSNKIGRKMANAHMREMTSETSSSSHSTVLFCFNIPVTVMGKRWWRTYLGSLSHMEEYFLSG